MVVSKTSEHIQIKIIMPNPSQISDHGYINAQWPSPNQDLNAKPESGTSSILQNPKSGVKGKGRSLHLQNQDREPKIWKLDRKLSFLPNQPGHPKRMDNKSSPSASLFSIQTEWMDRKPSRLPHERDPSKRMEMETKTKTKVKIPWIFQYKAPTHPDTIRMIVGRILEVNLIKIFGNFCYSFGGKIYHQ